jgi:hypothetical protein
MMKGDETVSPYVIVDAVTSRNLIPGAHTDVDLMVYLDGVLPVFTSQESLSEFARAQHPAGDPIQPTPLEVDPIRLAIMARELASVKALVVDPKISPSGTWIAQDNPRSASSYCRYIVELARTVKRLHAEGKDKLRDVCSDAEDLDKMVSVWVALQADKVNADARARVEEWEIDVDY